MTLGSNLDTEQLQALDNRVVHPWDDLETLDRNKRTMIQRSEGIYLYDSDGNRLIDGPGGMWCCQIGYGRQEMAQAVADQVLKMPYTSP